MTPPPSGRAPLRVALLGFGFAGRTFHAPLIQATEGLELRVVASSQPEAVRARLPEATLVSSAQEAATHPDVDLVVIATPNASHAPLAETALRAGKHVVVDKPFTVTLAEARALRALAHERGRTLSVFHNRRWDSDFLALRAVVSAGLLGDVTHVESRFDRFRPEVRQRWREQALPGAGVWQDLGPHLVDQALQLFGLPDRVHALLARHRDGAQVDDWCQVTLVYPRRHVVLQASMLVAGGLPRFAVHGTKGSWLKYGMDSQEEQLRAGRRPGSEGWGVDPAPGLLLTGDSRNGTPTVAPRGDYLRYYSALREGLSGSGASPVTATQALAVVSVMEAAVLAAQSGREQPPDLTPEERSEFTADFDVSVPQRSVPGPPGHN
ncbi:oxidoreductase [Pyxidicoccus xibeiensis]|uniref:oxidoreductase n=1 Tax=Pyxidicoccus xibeiensis TaxID=2906759 RepID=UPI0020A73273|nr:oxidoreductase [Pyxidicoccus xibeiensis]MCP3138339.1 oxidoreductase [Pyxidicoccus xibeiensis]